jgi:hypothetical protein
MTAAQYLPGPLRRLCSPTSSSPAEVRTSLNPSVSPSLTKRTHLVGLDLATTMIMLLAPQQRATRSLRLMMPRRGHLDPRNEGDDPQTVPVRYYPGDDSPSVLMRRQSAGDPN